MGAVWQKHLHAVIAGVGDGDPSAIGGVGGGAGAHEFARAGAV